MIQFVVHVLVIAESFWSLSPDCVVMLLVEFVVDWIKHCFITRFNEVPGDVYKDYTTSLAYDLAQTKQKYVCISFMILYHAFCMTLMSARILGLFRPF